MQPELGIYRIDLGYKGTDFNGWQSQVSGNAVQDHLERALSVFLRHPVRVTGASRTDSGVHAHHQVAVFKTNVPFERDKWLKALQHLLPKSIGVSSLAPTHPGFHPGRSATGKIYLYRIWRGPSMDPFAFPYVWRFMQDLDVGRFTSEAQAFCGRHDFSAFCAADATAKTRERVIFDIRCQTLGPELRIWIAGAGFLKQQIRIMIGTLVDVALNKREVGTVAKLLKGGKRLDAGRTAPSNGLTLMRITYEPDTVAILDQLLSYHSTTCTSLL